MMVQVAIKFCFFFRFIVIFLVATCRCHAGWTNRTHPRSFAFQPPVLPLPLTKYGHITRYHRTGEGERRTREKEEGGEGGRLE